MYKGKSSQQSSLLEEEYFYKKERDLINRIKDREQEKLDHEERSSHIDHCSFCGTGMNHVHVSNADILFCAGCESVHMSVTDIERIADKKEIRDLIDELRRHGPLKKSA